MSRRKYTTLKELDDVLGGADAWKNVSSTDGLQVLSCVHFSVLHKCASFSCFLC